MPELIWDGKYDAEGKRAAPIRVALPFQTVETVNESAQQRQQALDFFADERTTGWRNRLIWGDKKYVLPALLDEFAGKVDLIYIDPPFATGQDFSRYVRIDDTQFQKEPSVIEMKAYRDTWGSGVDTYLNWFSTMASHFWQLLSEDGSAYVHVDPGVSHYAKLILDEIFGAKRFRTEIIWKRGTAHSDGKQGRRLHGHIHDVVLLYTKGDDWTWNQIYSPYDQTYIDSHYRNVEEGTGRRFRKGDLTAAKAGGDTLYEWNGVRPYPGRYWAFSRENMEEFERKGLLIYTKSGMPELKRYLDEMPLSVRLI